MPVRVKVAMGIHCSPVCWAANSAKRLGAHSTFDHDRHDHCRRADTRDTRMRTSAGPPLLAHLPVDRRSDVPLHRQIYEGFRKAILDGMLRPGERVPSTRSLATDLGMSRLPVLTAYEQLLHEGYFEGRVGSGTYVCAAPPEASLRVRPRLAVRSATGPRRAQIAPGRDEGGIRPFRMSLPALDQFPQLVWARIVARHAHRMSPAHLAYGDPAGLGALRNAIAGHLR